MSKQFEKTTLFDTGRDEPWFELENKPNQQLYVAIEAGPYEGQGKILHLGQVKQLRDWLTGWIEESAQKCSHCDQPTLEGEGLCGTHWEREEQLRLGEFDVWWEETECTREMHDDCRC